MKSLDFEVQRSSQRGQCGQKSLDQKIDLSSELILVDISLSKTIVLFLCLNCNLGGHFAIADQMSERVFITHTFHPSLPNFYRESKSEKFGLGFRSHLFLNVTRYLKCKTTALGGDDWPVPSPTLVQFALCTHESCPGVGSPLKTGQCKSVKLSVTQPCIEI